MIGPGYGVSGPTWQLERAFIDLGCRCERFTLESLGFPPARANGASPARALFRFWADIVAFSTAGSAALWWRYRKRAPGTIVICQVDALYGDIFVVRSLHKGFLERHPSRRAMLVRNPLHLFVLARDHIRFCGRVHRHFVALSAPNRDEIVRLYGVAPDRITVIPNGVDLDRFQPSAEDRAAVRSEWTLRDDELVALFVGHEFERKGLRHVLAALASLRRRGVPVRLLVAGGDSPAALRGEFADLGDAAIFVGHRDDIERYYAAADVFVMPAAFDISPLVGPEALASGLPILMTDVGGVREYLRDGENGWFIQQDATDIATKLDALAGDRARLARMASCARASVAHRDWRAIARQYLELIDRLTPAGRPA
jgi:UDP-glucose:(heptosyl)LPS alpha-1,3-glucosyltransferase